MMNCEECFHYKACCHADTEEYMVNGEFPDECDNFVDSRYVQVNERAILLDLYRQAVLEVAKEREQKKREARDEEYKQALKADFMVFDELNNPIEFDRNPNTGPCKPGQYKTKVLTITGDVDISKEMDLLGDLYEEESDE